MYDMELNKAAQHPGGADACRKRCQEGKPDGEVEMGEPVAVKRRLAGHVQRLKKR